MPNNQTDSVGPLPWQSPLSPAHQRNQDYASTSNQHPTQVAQVMIPHSATALIKHRLETADATPPKGLPEHQLHPSSRVSVIQYWPPSSITSVDINTKDEKSPQRSTKQAHHLLGTKHVNASEIATRALYRIAAQAATACSFQQLAELQTR